MNRMRRKNLRSMRGMLPGSGNPGPPIQRIPEGRPGLVPEGRPQLPGLPFKDFPEGRPGLAPPGFSPPSRRPPFIPEQPNMPPGAVDQRFFNSQEYKNFMSGPQRGTADMYDSRYFGSMGSGSLGRQQESVYEDYLRRTGQDDLIQGNPGRPGLVPGPGTPGLAPPSISPPFIPPVGYPPFLPAVGQTDVEGGPTAYKAGLDTARNTELLHQASGLGSLFPVQQQAEKNPRLFKGGGSVGGGSVGGGGGEARSLALSRAHANSAARAADQRRADTSIRHAQVKAAEESARARQAKSLEAARVSELANATVKAAQEKAAKAALTRSLTAAPAVAAAPTSMYSNLVTNMLSAPTEQAKAANAANAAALLSPAAAHLEAARARFAKTRGLKAAIDQVSKPPSKVASVLASLFGTVAPLGLGLLASAPISYLHHKRNKELDAIANDYSAYLGDLASVLTDKEKSGFLNALSNLGLSFDPSTYEGKGGLGEDSWGPDTDVLLIPKPPGGGLATLPQSPSNTTQQVPTPFSPGLSVTIGNPLVPTIFPLS